MSICFNGLIFIILQPKTGRLFRSDADVKLIVQVMMGKDEKKLKDMEY